MSLPETDQHTPTDDPAAIAGWVTSLKARGLSPATLRLYDGYVRRLADHHDLTSVTALQIESWQASHTDWKPNTRQCAHKALCSYFRWARRAGVRPDNPTEDFDSIRVPATTGRPLPEAALHAALTAADDTTRLMIMLGAYAGLRRSEIAGLRREDLDGDVLKIVGKGGKTRLIPIGGELLTLLQACPPGWIFPHPRWPNDHLIGARIAERVHALLPPGYTVHKLRHRYATRIYERTRDLMALQQLLGHTSVETTRKYVKTDLDQLRAAAAAAL